MTIEQLEQAISNGQIADVERYNELLLRIKALEDKKVPFNLFNALEGRVKTLEESRLRQIAFNTEVTNKLKAPKVEEVKVIEKKSLWDFFR